MVPEKKTGSVIADSVLDLVGSTPLVRLNRVVGPDSAEVLVKVESFNPGGSIKDRVALNMIRMAVEAGLVDRDTTILEPTTGNTGIGLAMVCAALGYRCTVVMPDSMSLERVMLLRRFGAEVILTPGKEDMEGAVRKARALAAQRGNCFIPSQFENRANPDAHRDTTAREILAAVGERLDVLVVGVGTGGTLTGLGQALRRHLPDLRIVAVEPEYSPVLSRGTSGRHKIQGLGAGFVPQTLDRSLISSIVTVSDEDAFDMMARLCREEGILAGISSGAAVFAATGLARTLGHGRRIVAILPDTGERYLGVQHYFQT
ncbi:MAG: cysteine synthase A [Deltaproteobacteria bacterium]|nr:cysteine synthase A [Deltaproteobacteria bacterium]